MQRQYQPLSLSYRQQALDFQPSGLVLQDLTCAKLRHLNPKAQEFCLYLRHN
jgi:hypothetical protein